MQLVLTQEELELTLEELALRADSTNHNSDQRST
jgi:hypothetical protein